MRNSIARWKMAADESISPLRYSGERAQLAAALAQRFQNRMGLLFQSHVDVSTEDIERLIKRFVDDSFVQASLAGKHLDALYDWMNFGDYDDAEALAVEAEWAKANFEAVLDCPKVMGYDGLPSADSLEKTGERSREKRYMMFEAIILQSLNSFQAVA